MRNSRIVVITYIGLFIGELLFCTSGNAQIIHAGLKAGFNYSWVHHEDPGFKRVTNIKPLPGYNAGAVFSFKMKDRYFLHTEILFSTKGKITENDEATTNPEEDELHDRVRYNYIEIPLLYNIHFKGQLKLKNVRQFKWYAGIGPNFSYWLGGKGTISHYEITEFDGDNIEYKLKFGQRTEEDEGNAEIVYLSDARRLQLGINIGGGILLEPNNNKKIMIDLRFEFGHTWLGTPTGVDYVVPTSYDDNHKARNMGLRFSVMYLLEHNLDKKVRNKGKSTKKVKKRAR